MGGELHRLRDKTSWKAGLDVLDMLGEIEWQEYFLR